MERNIRRLLTVGNELPKPLDNYMCRAEAGLRVLLLFVCMCGTVGENWPSTFRTEKETLHDVVLAVRIVEEMKMKCSQAGIGQENAQDPPPTPP